MAYKRINDPYVRGCMKEYLCDTDADLATLPEACTGSMAVSLESGKVYVVSTFGNWIPFGAGQVEKDPNAPLSAGLYVDGVMTASWDELVSNGAITVENNVITGSNADALVGDLVIAEGITEIGEEGFNECVNLTSVVLPNSVTKIDNDGFWRCIALTNIVFGDGIEIIGDGAFYNCEKLEAVLLGDSVRFIGDEVFDGCPNVSTIIIGNNVTTIGSTAFRANTSLTSIIIPDSVTHLGDCAFDGCTSLTSTVIGSGVVNLSDDLFYGCVSLKDITYNGTVEQWNALGKTINWNYDVPATEVICTDGKVAL